MHLIQQKTYRSAYLLICLLFAAAAWLQALGAWPWSGDILRLISYGIVVLGLPLLLGQTKEMGAGRFPHPLGLLAAIFLLALGLRLIPYVRHGVPLGYDPGIYKYTLDLYVEHLPDIPESSLPAWIPGMHEQGLFVLGDIIHLFTDLAPMTVLQYLFIFLSALVVLPLFVLAKSLFGERVALLASLFYAVSYTQYAVFDWFYFRQVMGLFFLLLALYALEKRRYGLLALFYAALLMYHRPTFFLFTIIGILYLAKARDRGLIFAAAGAALLALPFWLPRLDANISLIRGEVIEPIRLRVQGDPDLGGGAFTGFAPYQQYALSYLPFALLGFFFLLFKREWNSLVFFFLVNFALVMYRLLFYNRYIVSLDALLVVLAPLGLAYCFAGLRGRGRILGFALVLMLVMASALPTMRQAMEASPLIGDDAIEALEWVSTNTEEDAFVLTDSYYAPWALGWSSRKVIAPGLFQWNQHNEAEWRAFFDTQEPERVKGFLDKYAGPLYIYYPRDLPGYLGADKLQTQLFYPVYQNGGVTVYKYLGQASTAGGG